MLVEISVDESASLRITARGSGIPLLRFRNVSRDVVLNVGVMFDDIADKRHIDVIATLPRIKQYETEKLF